MQNSAYNVEKKHKEDCIMKKMFTRYIVIWGISLVLFNIIAFLSFGLSNLGDYTASFWIGYISITLVFIPHLLCAWYCLKENNVKKSFYKLPLIKVSTYGLIITFIIGSICMLITAIPYWVAVIMCAIILVLTVIAIVKADSAAEHINEIDVKSKDDTYFIKLLTIDSQSLLTYSNNDEIKVACKKVYETIRYSDPVSNESLTSLENEIKLWFAAFSGAVKEGNVEKVNATSNECLRLLYDRNKKIRVLK